MDSWVICLEECLPDFGINLDANKIRELAKILKDNASIISSMEFEMCGGRNSLKEPDYKLLYKQTKDELDILKHENTIFRKSVAKRRNVDVNDVRIEDDSVMIYPHVLI